MPKRGRRRGGMRNALLVVGLIGLDCGAAMDCKARLDGFVAAHSSCTSDADCTPLCTLGASCDVRSVNTAGKDAFGGTFGNCAFPQCHTLCRTTGQCTAGQCN